MKKNSQQGFTLIELLVVIAIIGILSGIVIAALNTAKDRGEDSKTTAQLGQIRNGAELYYGTYSAYANSGSTLGICNAPAGDSSNLYNLTLQANFPAGATLVCNDTPTEWAAGAPSVDNPSLYFCSDSSGTNEKNGTVPLVQGGATQCP